MREYLKYNSKIEFTLYCIMFVAYTISVMFRELEQFNPRQIGDNLNHNEQNYFRRKRVLYNEQGTGFDSVYVV